MQVRSLASLSGLKIRHCCGVGHRCGWDPELLWLWCRLAATALMRSLAWEPPYAKSVALKGQKTKKNDRKESKSIQPPEYREGC